MTAENFCYWLKGILEVQRAEQKNAVLVLTTAQIKMIDEHLSYVFQPIVKAGVDIDYSTSGSGASGILDRAISGGPLPGGRTLIC